MLQVSADDDVLVILAPQNGVGACIIPPLAEMIEKADQQGAPIGLGLPAV